MTEFAGIAVIVLMGIAGILSMFRTDACDETVVTRPEHEMYRDAA